MEGKNLLSEIVICIGAGISQLEYILNLKKMGYKVFCADKDRNAPGFEMANDYIISSTFDFEKTPRLILDKLGQNIKIKGVVAPCTGPPYRTLQIIKQMYGLPYMSKKIVSILLDKVLLRNELNKSGLSKIKIYNDYDEIKPDNFPIVKKPRFEGMGGKGVELFYDYNKYKKIYSNNKIDQKFVYEEFINGTELAVDAIWCNDKIHLINLGYNVFEKDKIIGSTSEVSKSIKRYIPILTRMLTELCKNFKFYLFKLF